MTRYHLFGFDQYYPAGGMGDYRGAFDSPEAAAAYIRAAPYRDHWHLVTIATDGTLSETPHWWSDFRQSWGDGSASLRAELGREGE